MIPEEPDNNDGPNEWTTRQDSNPPDGSFSSGNWSWEGVSRLTSLFIGLALAAMFVEIAIVFGAQRYVPSMLLGVVGGLVVYELARFLLIHLGWPLFRFPAAQRLAEVLGFVPRLRRRFRGPRP